MVVKAKFLGEDGAPRGREYTYGCDDSAGAGEVAYTEDGKKLVIIAVDLPKEIGEEWGDKLKYISVTPPEAEGPEADKPETAQQAIGPDETTERELIVVKQLPIIIERLAALGEQIDRDVQSALALECNNDTVKTVKGLRAQLNKDYALLEERRKAVKKAIMEPYEQFEAVYKLHVTDKYRPADAKLKSKGSYSSHGRLPGFGGVPCVFKRGSQSAGVEIIQRWLRDQGYSDIVPDGEYGPKTAAAVKDWQKKNGLKADGMFGKDTNKKAGVFAW